jgi:hypothetical protein
MRLESISMEQISLNLTIAETNQILEALGDLPYAKVFQLIEKIKAQAEAQLRTQATPPDPASTDG